MKRRKLMNENRAKKRSIAVNKRLKKHKAEKHSRRMLTAVYNKIMNRFNKNMKKYKQSLMAKIDSDIQAISFKYNINADEVAVESITPSFDNKSVVSIKYIINMDYFIYNVIDGVIGTDVVGKVSAKSVEELSEKIKGLNLEEGTSRIVTWFEYRRLEHPNIQDMVVESIPYNELIGEEDVKEVCWDVRKAIELFGANWSSYINTYEEERGRYLAAKKESQENDKGDDKGCQEDIIKSCSGNCNGDHCKECN